MTATTGWWSSYPPTDCQLRSWSPFLDSLKAPGKSKQSSQNDGLYRGKIKNTLNPMSSHLSPPVGRVSDVLSNTSQKLSAKNAAAPQLRDPGPGSSKLVIHVKSCPKQLHHQAGWAMFYPVFARKKRSLSPKGRPFSPPMVRTSSSARVQKGKVQTGLGPRQMVSYFWYPTGLSCRFLSSKNDEATQSGSWEERWHFHGSSEHVVILTGWKLSLSDSFRIWVRNSMNMIGLPIDHR